jgi:purine-binding chemotaxis protein CheW
MLVCRVGTKVCALPLDQVQETMRPLSVESLPGSPSFVTGLAVIRGRPTPVVDARRLLGSQNDNHGPAGRYVTLKLGRRSAALAVDDVLGIKKLEPELLTGLPALLRGEHSEHVAALGALDAELLLLLDHSQLLPESLWPVLDQDVVPA